MRVGRRVRKAAAVGALTAALMAALAAPAAAAPGPVPAVGESLWRDGHFEISGAPVLPADSPPDGWLCNLLISCRPGVLAAAGLGADDPAPIAETREGDRVRVECAFGAGNWFKVHFAGPGGRGESVGWVAADAVDIVAAGADPQQCAAFVDW
jgi:hypothetical protein